MRDFLRKLMDFVVSVISSVILVFWLWIPALVAVFFVIVCILTGTSLQSNLDWFVIAMILSCGVSVALILVTNHRKSLHRARGTTGYRWQPPADEVVVPAPAPTAVPAPSPQPERPLVFATRRDPNIYIHEYSDRLEIYRRDGDNVTLLDTEFK